MPTALIALADSAILWRFKVPDRTSTAAGVAVGFVIVSMKGVA